MLFGVYYLVVIFVVLLECCLFCVFCFVVDVELVWRYVGVLVGALCLLFMVYGFLICCFVLVVVIVLVVTVCWFWFVCSWCGFGWFCVGLRVLVRLLAVWVCLRIW